MTQYLKQLISAFSEQFKFYSVVKQPAQPQLFEKAPGIANNAGGVRKLHIRNELDLKPNTQYNFLKQKHKHTPQNSKAKNSDNNNRRSDRASRKKGNKRSTNSIKYITVCTRAEQYHFNVEENRKIKEKVVATLLLARYKYCINTLISTNNIARLIFDVNLLHFCEGPHEGSAGIVFSALELWLRFSVTVREASLYTTRLQMPLAVLISTAVTFPLFPGANVCCRLSSTGCFCITLRQWQLFMLMIVPKLKFAIVEVAEYEKTEFSAGGDLFQYTVFRFGLCNASTIIECLMNYALKERNWKICLAHLDEIIIIGKDFKQYLTILEEYFHRLRAAGFKLCLEKCLYFGKEQQHSDISSSGNLFRTILETESNPNESLPFKYWNTSITWSKIYHSKQW
uniref:Reverse transcriptase domain-containing protein n=1 Tax=Glossina austeni TaxID=7395 RepID=A0A1A9V093_GLOAU